MPDWSEFDNNQSSSQTDSTQDNLESSLGNAGDFSNRGYDYYNKYKNNKANSNNPENASGITGQTEKPPPSSTGSSSANIGNTGGKTLGNNAGGALQGGNAAGASGGAAGAEAGSGAAAGASTGAAAGGAAGEGAAAGATAGAAGGATGSAGAAAGTAAGTAGAAAGAPILLIVGIILAVLVLIELIIGIIVYIPSTFFESIQNMAEEVIPDVLDTEKLGDWLSDSFLSANLTVTENSLSGGYSDVVNNFYNDVKKFMEETYGCDYGLFDIDKNSDNQSARLDNTDHLFGDPKVACIIDARVDSSLKEITAMFNIYLDATNSALAVFTMDAVDNGMTGQYVDSLIDINAENGEGVITFRSITNSLISKTSKFFDGVFERIKNYFVSKKYFSTGTSDDWSKEIYETTINLKKSKWETGYSENDTCPDGSSPVAEEVYNPANTSGEKTYIYKCYVDYTVPVDGFGGLVHTTLVADFSDYQEQNVDQVLNYLVECGVYENYLEAFTEFEELRGHYLETIVEESLDKYANVGYPIDVNAIYRYFGQSSLYSGLATEDGWDGTITGSTDYFTMTGGDIVAHAKQLQSSGAISFYWGGTYDRTKMQCSDLVKMWLYDTYGVNFSANGGVFAKELVSYMPDNFVLTDSPAPGVFSIAGPTGLGHTGLVLSVSGDTIVYRETNFGNAEVITSSIEEFYSKYRHSIYGSNPVIRFAGVK